MANWLRRCFDCGFPLARKEWFCPRCGARQRPVSVEHSQIHRKENRRWNIA
jgi:uncharacterized Zn finger protein (UPF0148 family)